MKRLRIFVLVSFLAALAGCSNSFVYNQLDWLIPWYLGDYVDLNREQQRAFKQELRVLLRWHRSEELARYVELLDGIEADLDQPLAAEQIEAWANHALAAYQRIEDRMLPIVFDLGRDLSDEQMADFIEKLKDDQRELEEKYLERSDEEYVEDTEDNLAENLGDFLGRLSAEQREVIEIAAASLLRFDAAWLDERRQWNTTLTRLLQREPGWEEAIMTALEERDANRTESYRSAYAHNAVIINQSIADVLNLRSEKQDRRLRGEIEDLRRDLRKLIAQGD